MQFGWLNASGAAIVLLLLVPNIIYAVKTKSPPPAAHKAFIVLEQIGRYGCIVFMWLPLMVWEFGFSHSSFLPIYLLGNACLLVAYYVFWLLYGRRKTFGRALMLSVLPTAVFLLCGVLLRHVPLLVCAVLFGTGHIGVCCETQRDCPLH